jgi:hypothetical protein
MRMFDRLDRPRTVAELWRSSGSRGHGALSVQVCKEVVTGVSDAFVVALMQLLGDGHAALDERGRLIRRTKTLIDAYVLRALERPLTFAELQQRLGDWTRGTDAALDPCTLGTIEGVSPVFASVMHGLLEAGTVRTFWGPRVVRVRARRRSFEQSRTDERRFPPRGRVWA